MIILSPKHIQTIGYLGLMDMIKFLQISLYFIINAEIKDIKPIHAILDIDHDIYYQHIKRH